MTDAADQHFDRDYAEKIAADVYKIINQISTGPDGEIFIKASEAADALITCSRVYWRPWQWTQIPQKGGSQFLLMSRPI